MDPDRTAHYSSPIWIGAFAFLTAALVYNTASKTRLFHIGIIPVLVLGVPGFAKFVVILVKVSAGIRSHERTLLSGPQRILSSSTTFYLRRCRADQVEPSV